MLVSNWWLLSANIPNGLVGLSGPITIMVVFSVRAMYSRKHMIRSHMLYGGLHMVLQKEAWGWLAMFLES